MPRVPPELNLKIGPFSVSAKGVEAVRAIRWPVTFAVALLVPVLAVYGLSSTGMLRSLLRRWWP